MVTRFTSLAALIVSGGAVALAIAAGPGCGIDSRSDAFRCDPRCPDDRECVDGWCVIPGADIDARADGSGGGPDASIDGRACPSACTSCAANTCTIVCDDPGGCGAPVVCPPGWSCTVECTGTNACAGGVRCAADDTCTVRCEGAGSCAGEVRCGAGRCDTQCDGASSCAQGVWCDASCRCDTQCSPTACAGGNNCPGPAQCEQGGECTSQSGVCRSC